MNLIGIDVSNDVFDTAMKNGDTVHRRQFTNTPNGHRAFCQWALRRSHQARVCLDATGVYHLQLALALYQHPDIEVMVVNPCAARRFAQAHMVRAKTDAIDADGLLQFLLRMPFKPWVAPRESVLQLQSLAHRMSQPTISRCCSVENQRWLHSQQSCAGCCTPCGAYNNTSKNGMETSSILSKPLDGHESIYSISLRRSSR